MRVGKVASVLGVSPDFVRDLERRGAIAPFPRDINGHRRLTEDDVARLRELIYGASARIRDNAEARTRIDADSTRLREWAERHEIPWPRPGDDHQEEDQG